MEYGPGILLQWNGALDGAYAYCVYRDDVIYWMCSNDEQSFYDQETDELGHCYNISRLCENGESELSDMVCVTFGDVCNPARNVWYNLQDNGKPIITWDAPENSQGLSAYFVFRKIGENGEYERIKIVSASNNQYKENKSMEYGNWYYYKVLAYYQDIECYSIPAKARYGNEYFVKMYYSPAGVDENSAPNIWIFPNPAKDLLTIKAEKLSEVVIYNSTGQKVFEQVLDSDEVMVNTTGFNSGIYLVKIVADGNEITQKISVIR